MRHEKTIPKSELAKRIAERNGVPVKWTDKILSDLFGEIQEELCRGNRIAIRNFGIFCVIRRNGRKGVDPNTGKYTSIPLAFMPRLNFSLNLRTLVNGKRQARQPIS